jgi:hypothetical protein
VTNTSPLASVTVLSDEPLLADLGDRRLVVELQVADRDRRTATKTAYGGASGPAIREGWPAQWVTGRWWKA